MSTINSSDGITEIRIELGIILDLGWDSVGWKFDVAMIECGGSNGVHNGIDISGRC